LQHLLREKVAEISDAAANDGLLAAEW